MDLLKIGKPKETTEVILYHPVTSEVLTNEDGSNMTITVHGPYSKKYKAIAHAQQNRRLAKAQRGGKMTLSAEEIENSAMELLVQCVEDWTITLGGTKPKATEAKVREVFTQLPWVKDQVDAALGDTQAFLEK